VVFKIFNLRKKFLISNLTFKIGWHDADLSDKGINEAKTAGKVS